MLNTHKSTASLFCHKELWPQIHCTHLLLGLILELARSMDLHTYIKELHVHSAVQHINSHYKIGQSGHLSCDLGLARLNMQPVELCKDNGTVGITSLRAF